MSIGTNQIVLICSPNAPAASPCPTGTGPAVVDAYTLDISASGWVESSSSPFSLSQGTLLWSAAFSSVLLCWFLAYIVKQVIKAVR